MHAPVKTTVRGIASNILARDERVFVNLIQFVNLTHTPLYRWPSTIALDQTYVRALFSNGVLAEKDILISSTTTTFANSSSKKISIVK